MDPISAYLIQLLIGVAISGVVSLAQQAFAPKPKAQKNLPGMRGQYSTGGTVPMTVVLGTRGVAGQLEYSSAWGNSGETPNAFNVDVISLSDHRITGVAALWVDTVAVTLPGTGVLARGLAIEEPEKFDGYAWYRFYTGAQDTADAYLLDKFGGDSKRPWLSDMAGEGISYAIQTARISETLWTEFPRYMYEVQGAPVFDPRLSTAAGGSGSQVWGTFSTYAFSDNAIVLALNVLLGIHSPAGDRIWGGRATLAQFDYANLAAAMDRCDDLIDKKAGGTEKRYRAGIEISLNERPADVLRDLLIAANARVTFTGGKYYFLVDVPDTADGSFTDDDLLIDEKIDFTWFPNLDDAVNGATATFLAPQRAWEERETKPYYRSDLEAEDHGQLNREKLALRCVFSGSQAQRIIKAVVEEGRRFKRHVVCLPDTYRGYRPLQALAWTSDEFQYSSKLFLILSRTVDEWDRVWLALQEIDPADFDWDAEADETELTFADTEESPVPSQAVAGWAVEPWDDGGRRPGAHMEWTGALDDIRVTRVQIRHDGETLPMLDREYPYEAGEATQDIYIGGDPLLRVTTYNARARFVPFDGSARPTEWSDWLTFTTPDVGLSSDDIESVNAGSVIGELIASQIADAAIIASKLATDAVTSVKIAAGAVQTAKLAVGAVTSSILANAAVQTANLDALAVTAAKVALATITAAQIASSTITTTQIAANTILAADIAAGTITGTEIAAGTITAAKIAAGTITATEIAAGTITATQIAAGAITATQLAAGAVTTVKLDAGAVTAAKIAAGTITGDRMVANTVSARELYLGDFTNMIPDAQINGGAWVSSGVYAQNAVGWSGFKSEGQIGGAQPIAGQGLQMRSPIFPVVEGEELALYGQAVHHSAVQASHLFVLNQYSAAGVRGPTGTVWASASWSSIAGLEYYGSYTVPAGVRYMAMEIWSRSEGVTAGANHAYGGFYVRRKNKAELIVDGAITASKVVAGTVVADLLVVAGTLIDTSHIGNNKVSDMSSVMTNGNLTWALNPDPPDTTVQTLSFTPNGGKVVVKGTFYMNTDTSIITATVRLRRNGTVVQTITGECDDIPSISWHVNYIDNSPGTSSVTWTITVDFPGTAGNVTAHHRYLEAVNYKK